MQLDVFTCTRGSLAGWSRHGRGVAAGLVSPVCGGTCVTGVGLPEWRREAAWPLWSRPGLGAGSLRLVLLHRMSSRDSPDSTGKQVDSTSLFLEVMNTYLFGRQRWRWWRGKREIGEREKDGETQFFYSWAIPQMPATARARNLELQLGSSRHPGAHFLACCCFPRHISRKLRQKRRSRAPRHTVGVSSRSVKLGTTALTPAPPLEEDERGGADATLADSRCICCPGLQCNLCWPTCLSCAHGQRPRRVLCQPL